MNQELIKTALMGTDRSTPSVFLLEKAKTLGVKSDEVTEIVLEVAGITSLMEKSGLMLKDFDKALPEAAAVETKSLCSIRTAAHLKEILSGKMDEAWGEFVFYAEKTNKIIPPEFLPQLIHYCRGNAQLWVALRPIIGERGLWLVTQHPDWQSLLSIKVEDASPPQPAFAAGRYQSLSEEETRTLAKEVLNTIKQNRFITTDDKKMTIDFKDLSFHSHIGLSSTLFNTFSEDLPYQWQQKINTLFNVLRFRKEMIEGLEK
jgi:Family of unknown function (DUF5691)